MVAEDKYIRVSTSDPSLDEKISINITNPDNPIYWYIGFNDSLDETSVNSKSMYVIDREGYILETNIRYLPSSNLIQISPMEEYIQGQYYILCITHDVRSANGSNLEKRINILFKIKEDKIVKFQVLADNVVVPEPKKRKHALKAPKPTNSKVYSFQKSDYKIDIKLKQADIKLNPLIGALGLLLTLISLIIKNQMFTGISATIAVFGIIHIVMQFMRTEMQSDIIYNIGVSDFNKGYIEKAGELFGKALKLNPKNELAEYALNKLSYYK